MVPLLLCIACPLLVIGVFVGCVYLYGESAFDLDRHDLNNAEDHRLIKLKLNHEEKKRDG